MNFSRDAIEAAQTPEELQAILSAAEPSASTKWTVATLTEVAEFFGVATSTAKGWRMESPPMPGSADSGWPLAEITRWRLDRMANTDLATAQKQATLESTQLANDKKRVDLAKERGELLERSEVELFVATCCIEFRELVMQLPEILATSSPPEMRDFIRAESDRHCREALKSAQRRLEMDELDKQTSTGSFADDDDSEPTSQEIDQ